MRLFPWQKPKDEKDKWKNLTNRQRFNRVAKATGNGAARYVSSLMNSTILLGICAVPLTEYFQDCAIDADPFILNALHQNESRNTSQAYKDILSTQQYTILGDSNHTDPRIREYFFGSENTQTMIDSGVKHVFIEYPEKLQPLVTAFTEKKLSEKEFVDQLSEKVKPLWWTKDETVAFHSLMANTIKTLDENGIRMHFVDAALENSVLTKEDFEVITDMASSLAKYKAATCPDVRVMDSKILIGHSLKYQFSFFVQNGFNRATLETLQTRTESQKKLVAERFTNNELVTRISQIAQNDKSVILYGSGHTLYSDHDLDELLGSEKTAIIELYGDEDIYADKIMGWIRPVNIKQTPDYVHVIDEGKVYTQQPVKKQAPFPSS